MNYFDLIFLVVLAFAIIRGLIKGFIIELASLVGLILGIIGAIYLSGVTSQWLANFITSKYISIIAFILLFVGLIILVQLAARIVDSTVKALALGWLNRILGGFFALIKSAYIISVLIFIIEFSGYGNKVIPPETREKSYLFIPLERLAPATMDLLRINYQHLLPQKNETPQLDEPVMI